MKVITLMRKHNSKIGKALVEIDGIVTKLDCTIESAKNQTWKVIMRINKRLRTLFVSMATVSCSITLGPLP